MVLELLTLLRYAAPVAFAALGETVGQKAGIINIGLEGMMSVGAYVGMLTSLLTGSPWLGLGAGIAAGVLMALGSSMFTLRLRIDQVVVGTAVNLFAIGLTGTLYRSRFGQSGQLISVPRLPNWQGLDAGIVFLLGSVCLIAWALKRTGWGLALRSAGEYPKATEAAGFSVYRLRLQACLVAGAFAGLAGAYMSVGITGSFAESTIAGRGFIAIAMVTFGRWKPTYVFLATLLIGLVESWQYRLQAGGLQVPFELMLALPYIVALGVLVIAGKGSRAPSALGQPYGEAA